MSEIVECKNRCVALYNSCDTIADRYFSFDELTARLGSGARPVEGVTDWRKNVCMYVYVLEILQLIFLLTYDNVFFLYACNDDNAIRILVFCMNVCMYECVYVVKMI